jgi:ABC-type Zn uptake system ZnuABC Zn-binding protein ZnuA
MRTFDVLRSYVRLSLAGVLALMAFTAACSTGTPAPGSQTVAPDALKVVATTTVLADMVKQVGGSNVSVSSLVPKGAVVETFDPSPKDVTTLSDADLIVMNGLGLDGWLEPAIQSSAEGRPVVRLAETLPGVDYVAGEDDEAYNPHLWLDVSYARKYVQRIIEALAEAAPAHASDYQAGGAAYAARLDALDGWVREQIDTIPPENRKLVSFHEAFPYFAKAYGLEIVGSVVQVPGQDPSAGEVAALIDAIKRSGARAVFTEAQFNPDLSRAIAREAGVAVESNLYNDSLGDPPVDTYEGLIRWDTERIVAALGGRS